MNTISSGFRKSVRGWRFFSGAGGHGQKMRFNAHARQQNPFLHFYSEKHAEKNTQRGGGRRIAVLLDPPVNTIETS